MKSMSLILFYILTLASLFSYAQADVDLNAVNINRNVGGGKEAYRKAIRDNISLLKTCLKPSNRETGNEQKIVLDWQVDDLGAVRYSKIRRSSLKNSDLETCIKEKIKEIAFPAAPSGQLINITYSVDLKD
jgi:hypothetical protein